MSGVTVERAAFARALASFRPLIKRCPIPIVECALLTVDSGVLTLSGTDLDRWLTQSLPCAGDASFRLVVPFERLERFVAASVADFILEPGEKEIKIRAKRSRFTAPTLDPRDWPNVVPREIAGGFTITRDELGRVIEFCQSATAIKLVGHLPVVLFDGTQAPTAAATNNQTLAVRPIDLITGSIPVKDSETPLRPLPLDALALAFSASPEGAINIRFDDQAVLFDWGSGSLASKIAEERAVPWRRYFSANPENGSATCDLVALREAVERVASAAGSTLLGFLVAKDSLRVRCRESVVDPDAEDEIECMNEGGDRSFGLNAKYTIDALRALSTLPNKLGTVKIVYAGHDGNRTAMIRFQVPEDETAVRAVATLSPRFYPEMAKQAEAA